VDAEEFVEAEAFSYIKKRKENQTPADPGNWLTIFPLR
jgi:hypothetical protein